MEPYLGNDRPDDPVLESKRKHEMLCMLFGSDVVNQACLIDAVDLNLNEAMIKTISDGVNRLKQLRNHPSAQIDQVREMTPGERLLLCLWIMDMDLLEKIQAPPRN